MTLLEVKGLKTYYFLPDSVVKAVDGVSFSLDKGEMLAVVGESGSGKSTLGLSILRLVPRPGRIVDGSIVFDGVDLVKLPEEEMCKVRGRKVGAVFQDPLTSLDPLMRVGEQLVETLLTHFDISREEAEAEAKRYLELVGISPERFYDYPHQFSGGMRQRAMIAMAVATKPSLVIADEPTTALDVVMQAQIMDVFTRLKEELGISFILITHDIALAVETADRIAVMYGGHLVELATSEEIYKEPLHPYTKALLEAVPDVEARDRKLRYIPGNPPDLSSPPPGCRFHPRCPYATEKCRREIPPDVSVKGRLVKCWLYG